MSYHKSFLDGFVPDLAEAAAVVLVVIPEALTHLLHQHHQDLALRHSQYQHLHHHYQLHTDKNINSACYHYCFPVLTLRATTQETGQQKQYFGFVRSDYSR